MSPPPGADTPQDASVLFRWASRNSELSIAPISDDVLDEGGRGQAFYCIHGVTGAAGSDYLDLARALEPTLRLYGVQAPPKKVKDPEFGGSVESIAEYYVEALRKFQPEGPFLLGGWSAGAIIALEIAQKLRARGREVGLLVAFDWGPENTGADLRPWNPRYLSELAANLPRSIKDKGLKESFHALVRGVAHKAPKPGKALAGKPGVKLDDGSALDGWDLARFPPDRRLFMNRLYGALLGYVPSPYQGDVVVYEASLELFPHKAGRRWRKIAPQSEIVRAAGNHLTIMRTPHADSLAKHLRRRIAEFTSGVARR